MNELSYLQDLARCAAGQPAPAGVDLRAGIWQAITRQEEQTRHRNRILRVWSITGGCGIAAAAMLMIGLYALQGMARDLSWNSSMMSLMPF